MLLSIAWLLTPFFLLGLIGYALRYYRIISNDTAEGLNTFTFRVIIPCLLIWTIAHASFPASFPFTLFLAYYLPLAFVQFSAYCLFIFFFRRNHPTAIVASLNTVFGNTAALGIPLAITLFGTEGALPYIILVTLHTPLIVMPSTIALELYHAKLQIRTILLKLLKMFGYNLNFLAVFIGVMLNIYDVPIPQTLDTTLEIFKKAALPCGLIAIGASLVRYGIVGYFSQALTASLFKIILLPLVVLACIPLFPSLTQAEIHSIMLMASLPTGITPFLIAGMHHNHGIRISTSSLFLTFVLSTGTVTFFLYVTRILYP